MWEDRSESRPIPVMFFPALLITVFLLSGVNLTNNDTLNDSPMPLPNETEFIEVDDFLNSTNQSGQEDNASEFIEVESYLNLTNSSSEDGILQVNGTIEPPAPANETGGEEPILPEEDDWLNNTEEFMDAEDFLNIT
ncbi:hypothetical protein GF412_00705, partial [Candidatus Micrarchaeota archaeon]|nr:hypothetical protein [Candidatus Micrarchaeota archaeon]MBD3417493.1 hypothetical protein [Candidatus Micrarchaeota archaeon]